MKENNYIYNPFSTLNKCIKLHFSMRGMVNIFVCCLFLSFASSCIREENQVDTPQGNFEALWKLLDERYCFFDVKQVDWDSIHDEYAKRITEDMPESGLFEVLGDMLDELKDGHVNLYSTADVARYWDWYEDYPHNFNEDIQDKYLGVDYKISGGLKYCILPENIGYVYYGSFEGSISESGLDDMLSYLAVCDGLIFDIRDNGGGMLTYSEKIASRFTNEKVRVGYMMHKNGPDHDDFSSPQAIDLKPSNRFRWQRPVVLLTNRHVFSAANDFTNKMKTLPLVTVMGDRTGGGAGLPFTSELPNGWLVRFSASPYFNADMETIEFGIEPDIEVALTVDDYVNRHDTLIDAAVKFLMNN